MSIIHTQEYEPIAIGNYGDDWFSSTSNKVADVLNLDSDFIYHVQNLSVIPETKAKKIYLKMMLGASELKSALFLLPENQGQIALQFVSGVTPDGTNWNNQIQKFNNMELQITDGTEDFKQSFIFVGEELSADVIAAGFIVIASWDNSIPPSYNEARLKVDKTRKLRQYVW